MRRLVETGHVCLRQQRSNTLVDARQIGLLIFVGQRRLRTDSSGFHTRRRTRCLGSCRGKVAMAESYCFCHASRVSLATCGNTRVSMSVGRALVGCEWLLLTCRSLEECHLQDRILGDKLAVKLLQRYSQR